MVGWRMKKRLVDAAMVIGLCTLVFGIELACRLGRR